MRLQVDDFPISISINLKFILSSVLFFLGFLCLLSQHLMCWSEEAFSVNTNLNLTRDGISSLICVAQPFWWWWQCNVAISYRKAINVALLSQKGNFNMCQQFYTEDAIFPCLFFFPERDFMRWMCLHLSHVWGNGWHVLGAANQGLDPL